RPDLPIGGEKNGLVVSESSVERASGRAPARYLLGCRQTEGMLLEPLAAEEFGPKNLIVVPGRVRRAGRCQRCRHVLSLSDRQTFNRRSPENPPAEYRRAEGLSVRYRTDEAQRYT